MVEILYEYNKVPNKMNAFTRHLRFYHLNLGKGAIKKDSVFYSINKSIEILIYK